nr:PAS domain S-box protein [Bacteroidota bacterium]
YTEAECIDKSIISLIVPVELKEEGKELSVAAMAGDFLKGETIRTSKDGKRIYVSIIGRHILLEDNTLGIFGIYRDISEKKQAEMALLESEKQFRNIVDNSLVGIYLVQKSILKYCNLKFAQIFGYDTPDEIENLNVLSIIAPESSDMVTEKMRRHEAGIDYIAHYEFQGLKKDGTKITIETLGGRIMHNNEVAIQGTLMDVTDRKQAERDLKEAKERAEESDRLKSVFLANMSHELRTPLNAVIGFSNLLGEAEDIDEYKDFAGKIYVSGIHLLNLIEDLFDISIIESGNVNLVKSLLNLKHLFMELHDQMDSERQIMKKANLSLMVSIPEDKPDFKMLTDPVRLKRIFTNLLKNAFKFTNEGFIEFGYVIMNNTIEFFVKDTGIGIDRSNKEIIFERFRQADDSQTRTYEGAGLGLFLTKKLVELLGGKIWLKSELNVGSTFYFSFPINSRQQSQLGETIYKKSDELDWRDKTILIAEDDDSNYLLLKSFLKKSQIKIVRAKTGKEAIDLALAYDNIDLILMDVKMPEVNGLDATKIIKEEKEYIPIIVQTAFAFESDIEKSLKAGCDDYISKPLNKRTLMEKIENQLFSVGELD